MTPGEPIKYTDFISGQANNLNVSLAPHNSVDLGLNLVFDEELGSAVSRLGTAQIGSQLVDNMSVLGLAQYVDGANSANNMLFAAINASGGATSVIKDVADGSSDVTGLTASKKMRFLMYGGELLAINGTDAERAYNGSSWITTGGAFDLGDYPGSNACTIAQEFLDRIYTTGPTIANNRIHYSTIASSGVITWNGDFFDLEPEDMGGANTAFGKVPGYLLLFKERSLHRYNGSSAFPESLIQIGTPSQEAVIMAGGLCAFYSNSNEDTKGFYITDGGRPQCISSDNTRPIKKWVDAIPAASDANVAGWATDRTFNWSIGDVTVDGEAYTNVVLRYNRTLNQWSVFSYPTEFKVFAPYLVSGVNTIVGGDDDGNVIRVDKQSTFTDAPSTTDIFYKLRTQHENFGFNRSKSLSDKIIVRGKNIDGINVSIIQNEDVATQVSVGSPSIWKKLLGVLGIGTTIDALTMSVELSGSTKGARAYIREIELPGMHVNQTVEA